MQLRLAQKLLAVVAISLALQIAFFVASNNLLSESETISELQSRSKMIWGHVNWVTNLVSVVCWSTEDYPITQSEDSKRLQQEALNSFPAEFATLDRLFAKNAGALALVGEMREAVSHITEVSNGVIRRKSATRDELALLRGSWLRFSRARDALMKSEKAYLTRNSEELTQVSPETRKGMYLAFLASIGLSSLALIALANRVASGLTKLSESAAQASAGKVPQPTIGGNDELQHIEKALCGIAQSLEESKQRERDTSKTDALSKLPNRSAFEEQGNCWFGLAKRHNHPLGVLLLDIDHFKQFNDSHGHVAGDLVIQKIAESVRSVIRHSDTAARWGGEEFAVMVPETDLEGCRTLAERLRETVARQTISLRDNSQLTFTVSVGCACLREDDRSLDDIVLRAESALYEAKEAGRNRVQISSAPCTTTT